LTLDATASHDPAWTGDAKKPRTVVGGPGFYASIMVDLLGRYSSRPDLLDHLHKARQLAEKITSGQAARSSAQMTQEPRPPHKLAHRLEPGAITELVASYQSGSTCTNLARRYKISKSAVLGILHGHGVTMRHQPLNDEQIAEAIQLYESGRSLAQVGEAMGAAARTIHRTLQTRGVAMRDTHGRVRL
jgi:hypothetical protein